MVVRIEDYSADGDLIAVIVGVFGGGGGDIDLRVYVVDTRVVRRIDFDLRVEASLCNHFDAPRNVFQPLQATISVFQVAEYDVSGRLDLERLDLELGIMQNDGLVENRVGRPNDSNGQSVLQIRNVVVDIGLKGIDRRKREIRQSP